jgi:MOSC domain-containing protein YiiM
MNTVTALCVGRSALLPDGKRSAIGKHPVAGPVQITRLGLAGDVQVDKRHHGGPEMAVHLYPLAHHAFWRNKVGDHPLLADPGAFGGNVAVETLDETQVRIGERFRLGSALLEISQPRMPCATIERRFERKGMVAAILESGRCGWYFRVIEEGKAEAGDALEPIVGSGAPHTVRSAFSAVANPAAAVESELLAALEECDSLSADWRAKAVARLHRHAL